MTVDLTQYGSGFLASGRYIVEATEFSPFRAKSGNDGVNITFADEQGATTKMGIMLLQSCYWRLARLCSDAGVPEEILQKFNDANPIPWLQKQLINRKVGVVVALQQGSDKYHEAVDTFPAGETANLGPQEETKPAAETAENPAAGCPF